MKYQLTISFDAEVLEAVEITREVQKRFRKKARYELWEFRPTADGGGYDVLMDIDERPVARVDGIDWQVH